MLSKRTRMGHETRRNREDKELERENYRVEREGGRESVSLELI